MASSYRQKDADQHCLQGVTYYGKERVEKIRNSTKRLRTATDPSEWVVVEGFTPLIISEAAFDLAQQKLKEPKARTGNPESRKRNHSE